MFSWEYVILRTLLRHKAGPLQNTIKIVLGSTMLFAFRRSHGHQLLGIQLRPMRLTRAKAIRAPSIQTDRFTASSRGQALTSRCTSPK